MFSCKNLPRYWRFGVTERINAQGDVLLPLNEDDVRRIAQTLREEDIDNVPWYCCTAIATRSMNSALPRSCNKNYLTSQCRFPAWCARKFVNTNGSLRPARTLTCNHR
ncbi:hypothetical protein [Candidatus Symbiopectobacterium sp. 'North America']|uniref:hypothetical protein n=1 Tax=Candidatus Symbiopectobacterium sp. 'North America' TaxID=2794574 RepID=UPI0035ABC7A3